MKAWLVVNGFLHQKKFQEIYEWLYQAGIEKNIKIALKTNEEVLSLCIGQGVQLTESIKDIEFVLFWDKDVLLAKTLEQTGVPVFNSSFGIEACDNKSLTHLYLSKEKIPMPDTIFAPMTYANIGYTNIDFIEKVIKQLGLPLVIKESFGSFGQQVYLCQNEKEVVEQVKKLQGTSFLFQRFIAEADGRDVRIQIVGNQVVAAMERQAKEGDFRANVTNGGSMKAYFPSEEEKDLAIRCCNILKVDFAGVDLLYGKDGQILVCEVNSNAHFKNIYDCTGVNTADAILEYIKVTVLQNRENVDRNNKIKEN